MLSRQPCQLDFRPRRCGDASPYSCVTSPHLLLYFPCGCCRNIIRLRACAFGCHTAKLADPPSCAGRKCPNPTGVSHLWCRVSFSDVPTTTHRSFWLDDHRLNWQGPGNIVERTPLPQEEILLFSCSFSWSVHFPIARHRSRSHGLPLGRGFAVDHFPRLPTFLYIFVVRYCIGLHVWVRAYCWLLVFLKYMLTDALNYEKVPSSHRGAEGTWRWLRLLVVPFLRLTSDAVPWSLYSLRSMMLPATTVGRHSL